MKYESIKRASRRKEQNVIELCQTLKVSASGYYGWLNREPSEQQKRREAVVEEMKAIHKSDPIFGARKIHAALRENKAGLSMVFKLARANGIKAKITSKYKPITTKSDPKVKAFPNLIFGIIPTRRNEIWVSDITYIKVGHKWKYLAVVYDLFLKKPVGWAFGHSPSGELVCQALKNAIRNTSLKKGVSLIHHSDQGSQYTSNAFKELLTEHGITGSMSKRGCPYDNAAMESFFQKLKVEHVNFKRYLSFEQANNDLKYYLEIYYYYFRPHASLNYLTPFKFEQTLSA